MKQTGQQPLVLLAEDDALVGLELCDALACSGFRVAGPLGTNREALAWIARRAPAAAILDTALKDGPTDELAFLLRQRGVPFLVHATDGDAASRCAALGGAPWLPKPAWHRDVVAAMSAMAARIEPAGSAP